MGATIIDQHNAAKALVAGRGLAPVGEMTMLGAANAVSEMAALAFTHHGHTTPELRVLALTDVMDSIIRAGQGASTKRHARDYRLMYRVALRRYRNAVAQAA